MSAGLCPPGPGDTYIFNGTPIKIFTTQELSQGKKMYLWVRGLLTPGILLVVQVL